MNTRRRIFTTLTLGVAITGLATATWQTARTQAQVEGIAPITVDGVIQPDVSLSKTDPAPQQDDVVEKIEDACSVSVVVKVPYANANASSLDDKDIILARGKALCKRVEGSPPTHRGVCQHNPNQKSEFTDAIPYSDISNKAGRFRWFCGKTAERARCKEGTKHVRFQIGPDRLFVTQCLK